MNEFHPKPKWRPSLSMIVFAVLLTVLALPFAVIGAFRLFDDELVRQTKRELLAQSAVVAAVSALEIEARVAEGYPLAKELTTGGSGSLDASFRPVVSQLDVSERAVRSASLEARPPGDTTHPAVEQVGQRVSKIIAVADAETPTGIRILDAKGRVFAGSGDIGLSFAHVPEIAEALNGKHRTIVWTRQGEGIDRPSPSASKTGGNLVHAATPVIVSGRVAAVVYASRAPQNLAGYLYARRWSILLVALTTLTAVGIIGFVFLRTVNYPLRALLKRTRALGEGDRDALAPLPRYGTQEVALLSEGIFATAKRLFDRSDFISTFAAHVSHELKSPLTAIQGAAELMRDSEDTMTAKERRRFLDNIVDDTDRLTRIVARLRELARAENPQVGESASLRQVVAAMEASGTPLPIALEGDVDEAFAMSAENTAILLSHLLDNAARHGAAKVDISAKRTGRTLTATVSDDGSGIAECNRSQIFDAFYTTGRETGGTGMGLAIVRSLLEAHGGSIRLGPSAKGATFIVEVPVA